MLSTTIRKCFLLGCLLFASVSQAQIVLEFCPVTNIQASQQWNATVTIRNNTGVVLDLANNNFNMEWPSLVGLQWPFSNGVQNGIDWSFRLNLDWPGTVPIGGTDNKTAAGNLYAGVLQFPTSGTYTQGGTVYTVTVEHCAQTNAYELYDANIEFDRNCFLYSPTSGLCLGEAASEIWNGEGVYDIMIPTNRPTWAIGVMVAHRLFSNLVGDDTFLSPNFWTATALNETRMTCDNTIIPNRVNYCYINSAAGPCQGNDIGNIGGATNNNCFQVLNIGYAQISANQPDLFQQTNAYGNANFNNVVGTNQWETGSIAVAYYHYQDIQYWNQIFCWNAGEFKQDAQDPYAVEKVFYHAFHDGPNAGISLLGDIDGNYAAATSAANMNTVIGTGGTWSSLNTGSQKVANFTSLLDGNGVIYPTAKVDNRTDYYGCYTEDISWTVMLEYFDKMKILYPQLMDAPVQADIQAVFNGINGGADVPFSNLGPVIDETVIQMGGHDPSSYIATQFAASKVCGENPVGVSLRTNDTLCPGESGFLQVWLAGDPNFAVDIQYPDGSINSFTGISYSPYNIPINQPGHYEVVYFEDADEVGDINCNFAAITVESKNSAIVGWDKSAVDPVLQCASGDLIINKTGDDPVVVSYTLDGVAQPDINLGAGDLAQTIATNVNGGEYIITTMAPNACGSPINDTITFCANVACTEPTYAILTPDTSVCDGDDADIRISLSGAGPFTIYYTSSTAGQQSVTGINTSPYVLSVSTAQTIQIDSVSDATCTNDDVASVDVTVIALPVVDLGADASICPGNSLTLDAQNAGASYLWSTAEVSQTIDVNSAGNYNVTVTDNGCSAQDDIDITVSAALVVDLGADASVCPGNSMTLNAGNAGATYLWSTGETTQTIDVNSAGNYSVTVTDNGCNGQDDIDITVSAALVVDLGVDASICPGNSITLDAGNAGATYLWSTGETTQTIDVNSAGNVSVTVTDNGCDGQDDIDVSVSAALVVDLGADASICPGNSMTLDAGNASATYLWSTGETTQTIDVNSAGNYSVTVTDNGCNGQDDIGITMSNALVVDLGAGTTLCPAQTLTLDAGNAGATYLWSTGETTQTIDVSSAGNVSVTVTDNGCNGQDDITVSIAPAIVVDLGSDQDLCPGDPLTLDAGNAGSSFLWSTGETTQTIDGAAAGNYSVVVTQGNCSEQDDIDVLVHPEVVVDLGGDTAICDGNTLTLDAGNVGSSFVWSTAETSQTIDVTTSNTYDVTVTDGNGCVGQSSVDVTFSPLPSVDLGADVTICLGAPLVLDAGNPGFSYAWSTGETTQSITVSSGGTYDVTVTGGGVNCFDTDQIEVSTIAAPVVDLGADVTLCTGQTLTLDATNAGDTYLWSTAESSQTIDVAAANEYSVIVTNSNNCEGFDTINVDVSNGPVVDIGPSQTLCVGESVILDAQNAGLDFLWSTGSIAQTVLTTTADWYKVSVTDQFGCANEDSMELILMSLPVVDLGNDLSLCPGASTTLDAQNAGMSYLWNTAETSQTITVSTTGNYSVTVSDGFNCEGSDDVTVTVLNAPVASVTAEQDVCEGSGLVSLVTAPAGGTLTGNHVLGNDFDSDSPGIVIDQENWVYYDYTDGNNCSARDSALVIVREEPTPQLSETDTTLCDPQSLDLFVQVGNGFDIEWMELNQGTLSNGTGITITDAGSYYALASSAYCDAYSDTIEVDVLNPMVEAIQTPEGFIQEGDPVTLSVENPQGAITYSWLDQSTGLGFVGSSWNFIPLAPSNYVVTATQEHCVVTDEIYVNVALKLTIPNVFSPNNDGTNDAWNIQGIEGYPESSIVIYNRWGTELLTKYGGVGSWDGMHNGKRLPVGTYYFVLNLNTGEIDPIKGYISLMK